MEENISCKSIVNNRYMRQKQTLCVINMIKLYLTNYKDGWTRCGYKDSCIRIVNINKNKIS